MQSKKNITGIVLAGGKSSRMRTDKGFVIWNDKHFVEYSIDALKPIVDEIIIVSDFPQYDIFGYKRVKDYIKEAGPLSALYSGLKESKTSLNFVLSCDVPLISKNVLLKLKEAHQKGSSAVVSSVKGKVMPLVALYERKCYKECKLLLDNEERRMMHLLKKLTGVEYLALDEGLGRNVRNINTKEQLKEIKNAN